MSNMQQFDAKTFLKTLTTQPGVYRMLGNKGIVLYVGKARNLKNRLGSYFHRGVATPIWLAQIVNIEITITHSESEALLLENTLIKQLQPRYNVLLRDDKSYPYLFISKHASYPRLDRHRGAKQSQGEYFGPYPSVMAVRETLQLLQKLFKLRQCQDSFFQNRSRPCLQYQIKRCSAPCVGLITPQRYQEDVQRTKLFLQGKNQQVIQELIKHMEQASEQKVYEQAAYYRDLIASLRRIHDQQYILEQAGDMDVIAGVQQADVCIQVMVIRHGRLLGQTAFFPKIPPNLTLAEIMAAFLQQYYLHPDHILPKSILLNTPIADAKWITQTLQSIQNKPVKLSVSPRGSKQRWLTLAVKNAEYALLQHMAQQSQQQRRIEALQTALKLESPPNRIECFDISHTMGIATVGACVVFNEQGPVYAKYRRFNVRKITKGDDYAALREVLTRHYSSVKASEQPMPDLVLIDGGKGQLQQAKAVFEELQIEDVLLLAIAKGKSRKPGLETVFMVNTRVVMELLDDNNSALHLLQQIRDEAHRYAITGHRRQRAKLTLASRLEDIAGIGRVRRRELLRQFGGLQEIKRASMDEVAKVPGISLALAKRIYLAFHGY